MQKRNILLILLIIPMVFSLIGCSKSEDTISNTDNLKSKGETKNELDEKKSDSEDENEQDLLNNKEDVPKKEGVPSPLSGLYGPEEKIKRRPVAVMIDNHPRARWQAGLSKAEIIYEFLVEGPYTRYMAMFLKNDPKHIGPVRSARPYFITTSLEYDAVYVHCGGSQQALSDIKKLRLADIDALASKADVFWRYYKTGKRAPNNLYTNIDVIRRTQKERRYRNKGEFEGLKFNEKDIQIDGIKANEVIIKYFPNNVTKYVYDEEQKVYKRYKDGKLHIDEYNNEEIIAKNIIIQEAKTRVIDNKGRLSIDLIGKGKGMYITNGKAIEITWEKDTKRSKTKYIDKNGNEIRLNPGVTWIQVTKANPNITIK
ncbi:DUF3048 domain-containing protein [Thermohalobacter berrensis]|uniref:Lipoprotein YerB n=1 Tax=Thermohalobacter berrensis TaxID=99594 RepID=A0A419TB99_9FIRM|nr:DUF3048 domain-containing protein [Thermohalobacter berrensis]RKD34727.1 hypothetical protein BET03_02585 [Thermohalobacter berrensis]